MLEQTSLIANKNFPAWSARATMQVRPGNDVVAEPSSPSATSATAAPPTPGTSTLQEWPPTTQASPLPLPSTIAASNPSSSRKHPASRVSPSETPAMPGPSPPRNHPGFTSRPNRLTSTPIPNLPETDPCDTPPSTSGPQPQHHLQRGPGDRLPRLLPGQRPHRLRHVQGHPRQPGRLRQNDLPNHPGRQPPRLHRRLEAPPVLQVPRGDHRAARQTQTSWHQAGLHHRERHRGLAVPLDFISRNPAIPRPQPRVIGISSGELDP